MDVLSQINKLIFISLYISLYIQHLHGAGGVRLDGGCGGLHGAVEGSVANVAGEQQLTGADLGGGDVCVTLGKTMLLVLSRDKYLRLTRPPLLPCLVYGYVSRTCTHPPSPSQLLETCSRR